MSLWQDFQAERKRPPSAWEQFQAKRLSEQAQGAMDWAGGQAVPYAGRAMSNTFQAPDPLPAPAPRQLSRNELLTGSYSNEGVKQALGQAEGISASPTLWQQFQALRHNQAAPVENQRPRDAQLSATRPWDPSPYDTDQQALDKAAMRTRAGIVPYNDNPLGDLVAQQGGRAFTAGMETGPGRAATGLFDMVSRMGKEVLADPLVAGFQGMAEGQGRARDFAGSAWQEFKRATPLQAARDENARTIGAEASRQIRAGNIAPLPGAVLDEVARVTGAKRSPEWDNQVSSMAWEIGLDATNLADMVGPLRLAGKLDDLHRVKALEQLGEAALARRAPWDLPSGRQLNRLAEQDQRIASTVEAAGHTAGATPLADETALARAVQRGEAPPVPLDNGGIDLVQMARDANPPSSAWQEFKQARPAAPAPEARPLVAETMSPESSPVSSLQRVDPSTVGVDARTFQFKEGGNAAGVTGRLSDVSKWEPIKGGVSVVYEDLSGQRWIVDGHQRLDLAKRAQQAGQPDVSLNAVVLREADGITREEARATAAAKNLAENSGTPVDAAKVIRELGPDHPEIASLPRSSSVVRDGRELAKLGEDAFMMVVNKQVPENYAAFVGRFIQGDAEQAGAMRALARIEPANARQAESIVRDIREQGMATRIEQGGLFGDEVRAEDLLRERAQIMDQATSDARRDKSLFSAIVSGESKFQDAGNVLAKDANRAAVTDSERLLAGLDESRYVGPVNDALNTAARRLKSGEITRSQAARDFLNAVREQSNVSNAAREAVGGARQADQAAELIPVIDGQEGLSFSRGTDGRQGMSAPQPDPPTPKPRTQPGSNIPSQPVRTGVATELPTYSPQQVKSAGDLARDLREAVGMRLLYGKRRRMKSGGRGGWFDWYRNQAASQVPGDLPTIYHELAGHALDKKVGFTEQFVPSTTIAKEMEWYGEPGNRAGSISSWEPGMPLDYKRKEGFAEFVRDWFEDPEAARKQAPQLHREWEMFLDRERKLGSDLRKSRSDFWARNNAPAASRIRAHIKDTDPTKLVGPRENLRWMVDQAVQRGVDQYKLFEDQAQHIADAEGVGLLPNDRNAYVQARMMAGNGNLHNLFINEHPITFGGDVLHDAPGVRLLDNAGIDQAVIDELRNEVEAKARAMEDDFGDPGAAERFREEKHAELDFYEQLLNDTEAPKSLRAILEPLNDNTEQFLNLRDYLVAARTLELDRRGLKTGIDVADARKVFDDLHPHFEQTARDIYKWQDSAILYAVEGGFLTPEQALKMKRANQAYVPFQRVFETEAGGVKRTGSGRGRGLTPGQPGSLKTIRGSMREIIDPFEVMVRNNAELIEATERNRVGQTLARMFDDLGQTNRAAEEGGRRYTVSFGIDEVPPPKEAVKTDLSKSMTKREIQKVLEDAGIDLSPWTKDEMVRHLLHLDPKVQQRWLANGGLPIKTRGKDMRTLLNNLPEQKLRYILEKNGIDVATPDPEAVKAILEAMPEKTLFQAKRNLPENIIRVKMGDGTERFFELEPDLLRAWKAMDDGSLSMVTKVLQPFANALRAGATRWNPAFILRNIARDTVQAGVVSRVGSVPVLNSLEGFYHLVIDPVLKLPANFDRGLMAERGIRAALQDALQSDLMGEFRRLRGAQEADEALSRSAWQKSYLGVMRGMGPVARSLTFLPPGVAQTVRRAGWAAKDAITSPVRLIETLSDISDQVARLGEMAQAKRALRVRFPDWTEQQIAERAAFEARDLMDFSQRGGSQAIREIRRVVPFLGSHISGNYRWLKALKEAPRATLAKALGYIALPALGLYMLNRSNPNYWMLDQRERDTMFHVPIPEPMWAQFGITDPMEAFLRIPKPHLLGTLFATAPQRMVEWVDAEQPESFGKLVSNVANAIVSGSLPVSNVLDLAGPLGKTWVELANNRDTFRGREIEHQGDQKKIPTDRYDEYTSLMARKMAGLINSPTGEAMRNFPAVGQAMGLLESPKRIDHAVGAMTGGAGTGFVSRVVDPTLSAITGDEGPRKRKQRLGGFETTNNYSEAERRWSERYQQLEKRANSKVLTNDERKLWGAMRPVEKQLKRLRAQAKQSRDAAEIDRIKQEIRRRIDDKLPVPMTAAAREAYDRQR